VPRPNLLIEAVRAAVTGDALISPSITVRLLQHMHTPAASKDHNLSARELDVVKLAAVGRTNAEIAQELFISIGTVKTHLASVQAKLDARNRVEIAAWAWEAKVVGQK
jgi:DNA-binding NarL/FixJ family response regulator